MRGNFWGALFGWLRGWNEGSEAARDGILARWGGALVEPWDILAGFMVGGIRWEGRLRNKQGTAVLGMVGMLELHGNWSSAGKGG